MNDNKSASIQNDEPSSLSDDENYVFKAKICKRLSRELNMSEMEYDDTGTYEPPTEPGLSNSAVIIPSYYNLHDNPSKILELDYFEIIKDDVRNCRVLNEYQLKYIKELSHECKNELFDIYNRCIKMYNDVICP
jgi:hypothetical protein